MQMIEALPDDETAESVSLMSWPLNPAPSATEVSFEFFPAATEAGLRSLVGCATDLEPMSPSFVSVTYGAAGSTQGRTLQSVSELKGRTDLDVAGHLTCASASRETVQGVVDEYVENGVRRIVALRGDDTESGKGGAPSDGYQDAAELVAGIRGRRDGAQFDISVAGYPEVHPKALSALADMESLKRKVDAGANRVLTQFFFDTDAFLRFRDSAVSAGITLPIVPGIMPVGNFAKIANFSRRCGTVIPDWMSSLFEGLEDGSEVARLVAASVTAEQCRRLSENGVERFHFYTMNKPELTVAVCRMLGLGG